MGTCPTGRWPQFQSLQEKEVSILNSRKCEQFYHKFSRISSLVRIITSQMICASDNDREKFCYVRTSAPVHLSRGPGWRGAGGRAEGCGEGREGGWETSRGGEGVGKAGEGR